MLRNPLSARVLLALALTALPNLRAQGSAQVRTVANGPSDRELPWQFREDLRIGAALDGPAAFVRVSPWTVATDAQGNIYVLDVGDHRVAVFDGQGRHIRDLGREGGGPGEFRRPVGLTITPQGTVVVADAGKPALVRFDSAGSVLTQVRLDSRAGAIGSAHRALLIGDDLLPQGHLRLLLLRDSVTTVLAEVRGLERQVSYRGCRMSVPGRPFFAPMVTWAASGGTIVLNDTPDYRLRVWRDLREAILVTRDIPPMAIARATALRAPEVRAPFRIR